MTVEINTVVRFHDIRRLAELKRCVFSLVGQTYRPLNIILALQRFSPEEISATQEAISPLLKGSDAVRLTTVNYDLPQPADARAALLNVGMIRAGDGYLAFLDYDDVLYPEAYMLLSAQIQRSKAAIAFATVRVMRLTVYGQYLYTDGKVKAPFGGTDLVDLFRANFCPLHSYLIDKRLIEPADLRFNTAMTIEEDYDFLLRICAKYRSDFRLVRICIGDYYYKTDGSNTVATEGGLRGEALTKYMAVRAAIEERRRTTVVAPTVLHSLGLPSSREPTTIQNVVNQFFYGWATGIRRKPPLDPSSMGELTV